MFIFTSSMHLQPAELCLLLIPLCSGYTAQSVCACPLPFNAEIETHIHMLYFVFFVYIIIAYSVHTHTPRLHLELAVVCYLSMPFCSDSLRSQSVLVLLPFSAEIKHTSTCCALMFVVSVCWFTCLTCSYSHIQYASTAWRAVLFVNVALLSIHRTVSLCSPSLFSCLSCAAVLPQYTMRSFIFACNIS